MTYQHIQYGGVIYWTVFTIMIIAMLFTLLNDVFLDFSLIITAVCILTLTLFYNLRTEVTQDYVYWGFGLHLFQGKIPIDEIESCEIVELKVWEVGGLKWFPSASIYSLGGKEAVAIKLKNKKRKIIIGTDDALHFYRRIQINRGAANLG